MNLISQFVCENVDGSICSHGVLELACQADVCKRPHMRLIKSSPTFACIAQIEHQQALDTMLTMLTFRHIRTLQQENKELRAALEEHQNALELIMSKYRQHVTRYMNIL